MPEISRRISPRVRRSIGPRIRRRVSLSLAAAIVPALALTTAGSARRRARPRTVGSGSSRSSSPRPTAGVSAVKDTYIVELKKGVRLKNGLGIAPQRQFSTAVNGFSAKLTQAQLADLQKSSGVVAISQDVYVQNVLDTTQTNPPVVGHRPDRPAQPAAVDQLHLHRDRRRRARLHHRHRCRPDAPELRRPGASSTSTRSTPTTPTATGTAPTWPAPSARTSYGVAKSVRLHGVKWLNCSGSGTIVGAIAGGQLGDRQRGRPGSRQHLVERQRYSTTLANALSTMMNSGVFLAASAGNTGGNSCDRLPRKTSTAALVVARLDEHRCPAPATRATGSCVDIYGPGSAIVSTAAR